MLKGSGGRLESIIKDFKIDSVAILRSFIVAARGPTLGIITVYGAE